MQLPAGSENTIGRKELGKGVVQAVHLATDIFPVVTSLPVVNVVDGQIVFYQPEAGKQWMLRYNAESTSAYKWEYVGGPSLIYVATDTTTRAVSAYGDAASGAATTFTLALAGDYRIEVGATLQPGAAGFGIFTSFSVGGATALDTDGAVNYDGAGEIGEHSVHNVALKTGLAAGTTIQQKFKMQGTVAGGLKNRYLTITPIRVG